MVKPSRRSILRTALGVAAGAVASPILRALAREKLPSLRETYRRAALVGRSVLVIPVLRGDGRSHDVSTWQNGRWAGAVLCHGGDELLSRLACVEIVCAEITDLREIAPSASVPPEPVLVLIEPREPKGAKLREPTVVCFEVDRAVDSQEADSNVSGDSSDPYAAEIAAAQRRCDRTRDFLLRELGPEFIARAVLLARRHLPKDRVVRTQAKHLNFATFSRLALRLSAPLLLERAAHADDSERREIVRALAGLVRRESVEHPPAGAVWAYMNGCTLRIEGRKATDDKVYRGCGIGFTPAVERRFLHFLDAAN